MFFNSVCSPRVSLVLPWVKTVLFSATIVFLITFKRQQKLMVMISLLIIYLLQP